MADEPDYLQDAWNKMARLALNEIDVLIVGGDWKGDQRNRDGYQHCGPVPYECRGGVPGR